MATPPVPSIRRARRRLAFLSLCFVSVCVHVHSTPAVHTAHREGAAAKMSHLQKDPKIVQPLGNPAPARTHIHTHKLWDAQTDYDGLV